MKRQGTMTHPRASSARVRSLRLARAILLGLAPLAAAGAGCDVSDATRVHGALEPGAPAAARAAELTGSIALPLVTPESASFRLRSAVFDIERSGVVVQSLDSESNPDADALTAPLDPGQYQVRLLDGWSLERLDAESGASAVRSALISLNPASFSVRNGRVTTVAFTFTTRSGVVTFGEGAVSVRLDVTDRAALGSCDLAHQAGCPEGQHCLLGDADGNTFCATPGSLPLGADCSSEQCVFGAQCLSDDPARPEASVCTALCNPLSPPFGCDCRGLGGGDAGVCGPPPPGSCDLLDPTSCAAGLACQLPGGSFGVCAAAGSVSEGASCFGEECEAGLDCFGDEPELGFPGTCYRFCDVLAPECEFCFAVDTGDVGRCFL